MQERDAYEEKLAKAAAALAAAETKVTVPCGETCYEGSLKICLKLCRGPCGDFCEQPLTGFVFGLDLPLRMYVWSIRITVTATFKFLFWSGQNCLGLYGQLVET